MSPLLKGFTEEVEYISDGRCYHVTGFRMGACVEIDAVAVQWDSLEGLLPVMLLPNDVAQQIGMALMTNGAGGKPQ